MKQSFSKVRESIICTFSSKHKDAHACTFARPSMSARPSVVRFFMPNQWPTNPCGQLRLAAHIWWALLWCFHALRKTLDLKLQPLLHGERLNAPLNRGTANKGIRSSYSRRWGDRVGKEKKSNPLHTCTRAHPYIPARAHPLGEFIDRVLTRQAGRSPVRPLSP